jgi:hypothetical protein
VRYVGQATVKACVCGVRGVYIFYIFSACCSTLILIIFFISLLLSHTRQHLLFYHSTFKMKFTSSLAILGLVLSASATPLTVRTLATIEASITSIETAVNALDAAEKAYTGGATTALQTASNNVVSVTDAGTTVANASPALSDSDALALITPIQTLVADVQAAVKDLIAKKTQILAAGAGAVTLASLIQQNTSSAALANAITAKVPADLQTVAAELSGEIVTAIESGITAFS